MLPVQKQTPPTQAAKSHLLSGTSCDDLAESKSSASRSAASLLDDGGSGAETLQEDMFIFSNTAFNDFWDVCASFDVRQQPDVEVKESPITKVKNSGDSEPQASNFKSYRWAPLTPVPGMMQMIGLVPVPEEGFVEEPVPPFSQGLPERVLALPLDQWSQRVCDSKPYFFRSKFLCQLNPLMLPVMEVNNDFFSPDEEWKLRDLLAQRTEKLRVLILSFGHDLDSVLSFLGRLEDLLSDVTTVAVGNPRLSESVYVIDLAFSENVLNILAMLLKSFTFHHNDEESFVRTILTCTSRNESWHVVEATVQFDPSIYAFVSAYPQFPNIYFGSWFAPSINRETKIELSNLIDCSDTPTDLSEFPNLRSLFGGYPIVASPSQRSHGLRHLEWTPVELTRFNDCAWGCLLNLQCLSMNGDHLHPSSRLSLQCFPKLVSLSLSKIAESIVVEFGHLPLRLNNLELCHFQGSLEGSEQLQIERLCFSYPVCSDAHLQLCPISEKVEIKVSDIEDACLPLSMVADQLKFLKLSYDSKRNSSFQFENLPFNTLCKIFPLLESLNLVGCSLMLSATIFPRLHHLSLDTCDVLFPECGVAGLYGDSFPELVSLAIIYCELFLERAVPDDDGRDPLGVIYLQANSLLSLKLINVSNLKMLQIHRQSFPCLQTLHCHVANDDFPFPLDIPEAPLFPHLHNLSLKKRALDGKRISLEFLVDMNRLDKLELLENVLFALDNMKPFQCRWVRFSSPIVEQEDARHWLAGGIPLLMKSSTERVTFFKGLVSKQCEILIIDELVVCLSDRHFAQLDCIRLPMLSGQIPLPPTQAAKVPPIANLSHDDLAESKSFASRSAASLLADGSRSAKTPQGDMFIFSDTAFQDLQNVCEGFDVQEQPEVEAKEAASTKVKSAGNSGPPASSVKSYRWALKTPIPGMMQTISLVPVPKESLVGESALSVSQGLREKVLGLPVVAWDSRKKYGKPYCFRSRFLCQLNPLMLPVMKIHNDDFPSDEEWKLRDLLAKRTEKLRVLILLFDEVKNVETLLFLLGRLEDLLSDVTTVVLGDPRVCGSVYVVDLSFSENRLSILAMLLETFTFQHYDEESLVKTMSACIAQNGSWHVVEATIEFDPSLHAFVSACPESSNIHFSSYNAPSLNQRMKNELSNVAHISGSPIDLSNFRNLRSLDCHARFVISALQQSCGLRYVHWVPQSLTRFNDCAWGCLLNLQCLSIDGDNLHPSSRILLQCFPQLISLSLSTIAESIVIEFGHLPLRLNNLELCHFYGTLEGSEQLQIEKLLFTGPVCSNAHLQLSPKSEKVEIDVSDIEDACRRLLLVADQLKCLKLTLKFDAFLSKSLLPFGVVGRKFPLLESLELVRCDMMLSAVIFPRLHHLLLDKCNVLFPKGGIGGLYGDSFPELVSMTITNCNLLLDGAVPDEVGKDPGGVIHLQANSLLSLKLINVSNLKMLQIHKLSFSRLQNLHCHVANDDDFPFLLDEPGEPLFPHLRNLSLKKNALDGKQINLDLLAAMGRLERLELLDNAFYTLNDVRRLECRWIHISSAIVEREKAIRRHAGGMPFPMGSLTLMVTFAVSLVSEHCEKLIISRHLCLVRDRANVKKWYPPMYGFTETSMNPGKIKKMVEQREEVKKIIVE